MHSRYRDKHVLNHKLNSFNLCCFFSKGPFPTLNKATHLFAVQFSHSERFLTDWLLSPLSPLFSNKLHFIYFKTTLNRSIVSKITPITQETTKHPKLIQVSIFSCTRNARNTHYAKVQIFLLAQIMTDTDMAVKRLGLSETDAFTKSPCQISHLHNGLGFHTKFPQRTTQYFAVYRNKEATQSTRN